MLRPSKFVTNDEKPLNTHPNHRILVSSYPHRILKNAYRGAYAAYPKKRSTKNLEDMRQNTVALGIFLKKNLKQQFLGLKSLIF